MKILNCMFSKMLGGLEQAFIDYSHALMMQHNQVLSVIHPNSTLNKSELGHYVAVPNFNSYDFFAMMKLRKLVEQEQPHCIITHGKRATQLFKNVSTNAALIAVSHKQNYDYLAFADAIIAVTKHMQQEIIASGIDQKKVHYVPNMINIPDDLTFAPPHLQAIPVIGVMARLTPEKGVDVFIKALAELKKSGCNFLAKIAGDGSERSSIISLIEELNLSEEVEMLGWVNDKAAFYKSVDIVCVPSRVETFGIVILEAFLHSKPCVATSCIGPNEIGVNEKNMLLCPINDPQALSHALQRIINDSKLAFDLASSGFIDLQNYSLFNVSRTLQVVIEEISFKKINKL